MTENLELEEAIYEGSNNVALQKNKEANPCIESLVSYYKENLSPSSLIELAKEVGYWCRIPKRPGGDNQKHLQARMQGYEKRMKNWIRGLVKAQQSAKII